MEAKLYINGRWVDGGPLLEVTNKYTGQSIGAVATARREEVDGAIAAAEQAAPGLADLPAHRRAEFLARTAALIGERREEFARTIAAEAGKALKFARVEVDRAVSTFSIAAEEAKRLHGETIPLDAVPAGEGYFGFWVRRPVGVIAAISPFNFPLNLVAHKVAPGAGGRKCRSAQASQLDAPDRSPALPGTGASGPPGRGHQPGGRVRRHSGQLAGGGPSRGQGDVHRQSAGRPRDSGPGRDQEGDVGAGQHIPGHHRARRRPRFRRQAGAVGAFYNSGQVCISVQRIYSQKQVYEPFLEKFVKASAAMVVGDPLDERVDVGPMIDTREAARVEGWVQEAVQSGAQIELGAGATAPYSGRRCSPVRRPA